MKMITKIVGILILGATFLVSSVTAQGVISTPVGGTSIGIQNVDSSIPNIPIDISDKGRRAITEYLLPQVNYVTVNFSGMSVVNGTTPSWYLSRDDMRQRGYIHDGMFSELTNSLANIAFSGQVIPTPGGWYDVECQVYCWSADNKLLLSGGGSLSLRQNPDGTLSAGTFDPWLQINNNIVATTPSITTAKWLGPNYQDQPVTVVMDYTGVGYGVLLSMNMIDQGGSLIVAGPNGNLFGWSIGLGTPIVGKAVHNALLGNVRSSDVLPLVNATSIGASGQQFYTDNGQIYGRFPLLDVTTQGMNVGDNFTVPVWGSKTGVQPSRVYVTPMFYSGPVSAGSTAIGQEFQVPSGYTVSLPAGGYHIRVEFDQVLDWDANPNPKG